MKKIPTVFIRDWDNNPNLVTPAINPECEWVIRGEGIATKKLDGSCCMVRDGLLFKRREVKAHQPMPVGFEVAGEDHETGKIVGWMPVGQGSEDQYHREAFAALTFRDDNTYELIGPKVQGNPYNLHTHMLIPHSISVLSITENVPRDFYGLKEWLSNQEMEGIVFHHSDGRMAKIKKRDFGIKWSGISK